MGSAPELPCAAWQLRLVPIPDVSDSLDRYQFDLRAARVGGIESTWVSHYGIHMIGRAATATSSPGHEKSCPRPVQRLHPAAMTTEPASANSNAPPMRLALRSASSANDRPRRSSTVNRQIRSAADASSITLSIRRPAM